MTIRKIIGYVVLGFVMTASIAAAHKPWVALTFDDGPNPETTEKILDILAVNDIHATFFLIGKNVEAYPDIVKHIVGSGNAIGNHTWDHPNLKTLSFSGVRAQIEKTQKMIQQVVGFEPYFFRPPYGVQSPLILRAAGLASIQRSIDTKDWQGPSQEDFLKGILDKVMPGSIILMHDGMTHTVDYLPALITALRKKGYSFATIPMMFGGSKKLKAGQIYRHG